MHMGMIKKDVVFFKPVFFKIFIKMTIWVADQLGIDFFFPIPGGDDMDFINALVVLMKGINGFCNHLGSHPGNGQQDIFHGTSSVLIFPSPKVVCLPR